MKLIIAEVMILNGFEFVDEQALNIIEEMISLCKSINYRHHQTGDRHEGYFESRRKE